MLDNLNLKLEQEETVYEEPVIDFHIKAGPLIDEFDKLVDELKLANEGYEFLNNPVENEIKQTIAFTCGMLGVSREEYDRTFKLELNHESILESFKQNLTDVIGRIWNAIKEFFQKVWVKIQAYYYDVTKNIFNIRKKIYGLRNKTPIALSNEDYLEFVRDFKAYLDFHNTFDLNDQVLSVNLSIAIREYFSNEMINKRLLLLEEYGTLLSSFSYDKIQGQNQEELIKYYKDSMAKIFNKHNDNNLEMLKILDVKGNCLISSVNLENGDIEYVDHFEDDMNNKLIHQGYRRKSSNGKYTELLKRINNQEYSKIDYICMARLAEVTDEAKGFIVNCQKVIFKTEKEVNRIIKEYPKLTSEYSKIRNLIENDISSISSRMFIGYVQNIIKHIRFITKWINRFYKQAKNTTLLGIQEEYEKIKKSKSGEYAILYGKEKLYLKNPKEVSLVQNGEMVYFTLSKEDWDNLRIEAKLIGGFCLTKNLPNGDLTDSMLDKDSVEENNDINIRRNFGLDRLSLGLIFLDTHGIKNDPVVKTLFDITGDMRFLYYHELGHLVTGQHENRVIYSNTDNLSTTISEYTYSRNENRADAFACLKCGIPPEKIVNLRIETFKKYSIDRLEDNIIEKYRKDMLFNIKREISGMRGFVKLSLIEYLKSKIISKDPK